MADRLHPYSLFPQNLTPNPLQQSQIPQQPPQSQQPDPQMIPALSNPEHSHMWQISQMSQLQNPYRSQQPGDLAASSMNHQMQEFARGQALSHGQGQPIIQQSFGLNAQRMNPPGTAFHDPQASQPQPHMPSGFPNVPMNTQQAMKASFNMNPMMHAAMNNSVSRPVKMPNQQDIARFQLSGLNTQHAPNQPAPVDMFPPASTQRSQDQMHGSPHPAAQPAGPAGINQGMMPGNPQPNIQKRAITPADFQERRNFLLNSIAQAENGINTLLQTARNAASIEPHVQHKLGQLRTELANRKELYTKFVATFGAMMTQQMANGMPASTISSINSAGHAAMLQPQQAIVSNAQVQSGFVTQASQPVAAQYNIPAGNGPSPMPTQNQGALNQQIPIQPTHLGRPNTIPLRTGGTPHQISGGQLPNTISPNLGISAAQGGRAFSNQTRQLVMPLEKQRFESTYTQFRRSQGNQDMPRFHVPIGDNGMVDLYQLHVYVMHEGGAESVTQRDLWSVIGGRLGFIQFPSNGTEPARSGPGIGQQLQNTYDVYLRHFEQAYVLTVKNRPATGSPQQSIQQVKPGPPATGNSATPGMSGNPAEAPPNPPRQHFNQHIVVVAAQYAHVSAQDMRKQHVPEQMITFVERNRSDLIKVYQQQALAKRNAEQEQQNMANAQGQLPNMHEQAATSLQSSVQRPPQAMGVNLVSVPSDEAKVVNGPLVPENVAAVLQKQPTPQNQMQHASMAINQLRQEFQPRLLEMPAQQVTDDQRLEYNQLLEQVYKMTSELDQKLYMYLVVFKSENLLRKYVAIVMTVAKQRQLSATSSHQYIINLMTLRAMQMQIHKLNEEFDSRWRAVRTSAAAAANPQQHPPLTHPTTRPNSALSVPPIPNPPHIAPPAPQGIGRPVSINPSPEAQQLHRSPSHTQPQPQAPPQSHPQPNQPQQQLRPQQQPVSQPIKKPFHPPIPPSPSAPPAPATLTSPTPPPVAASSSTPATSAPTPQTTAGSPQTPKSPPSKVAAKSKVSTRVSRKTSGGKGPATPETVPSVSGVKRPPEEDVATLTNIAPSEAEASNAPSPKKARTEWEGEMSEALLKKQQELDNIKTDEDATAFFDRMKEFFAMTASTDNEIHHDIASTLDQILAGVAQEPADAAATAAALSVHGVGDAGPPPTALSPHMGPANDAFLEFIDFSTFTTLEDEDNDSKAPTPDLVPSSETNPSPESGSEGDLLGSTGSLDKTKIEEPGDRSDPLRLGSLREIDGGESAYYQPGEWKWEGPMHTLDQPWAIFTS